MTERNALNLNGPLGDAINKLFEEIREGIKHGFYECAVTCEVIKGGRRRLTIRAGKSHRFIIREEDLSD
jgi:hypothetical protein